MKKGITLVTLAIVVLILFTLIGTITISSIATYENTIKVAFATEFATVTSAVQNYYKEHGEYPISDVINLDISNLSSNSKEQFDIELAEENSSNIMLYAIDYSKLGFKTLKYGAKADGDEDIFGISLDTGNIYYAKGITAGNYTYYTLTDELLQILDYSIQDTLKNKDGIIVDVSSTIWTKEDVLVEVTVPKEIIDLKFYLNGETFNVTNIEDSGNNNIYKPTNIKNNSTLELVYTKDGIEKTLEYVIDNIDKALPTLDITIKDGYFVINASDDISDIDFVKYEFEKISGNDMLSYFESNGMKIENETLKIPISGGYITIYAKDKAGNWIAKYIDLDNLDNIEELTTKLIATEDFNNMINTQLHPINDIEHVVFRHSISPDYHNSLAENKLNSLSSEIDKPIVAWFDNKTKTLYIESDYTIRISSSVTKVVSNQDLTIGLFTGFTNLKTVDLVNFNTSTTTSMRAMFKGCENLNNIDLSKIDTINVTDMAYMFSDCKSLDSLDISSFNTENVINMEYMFYQNLSLVNFYNIDNENLDEVNNESYKKLIEEGLPSVKISNLYTTKNVTNTTAMFKGSENIKVLDVSSFDTSNVRYMQMMFSKLFSIEYLDLSKFNTSKVINMEELFSQNLEMTYLDVSNFNTTNVTNMAYMFNECRNLNKLDLRTFNTSNVTTMENMFYGVKFTNFITDINPILTEEIGDSTVSVSTETQITDKNGNRINVGFITNKVLTMEEMFADYSSVDNQWEILDLRSFDTTALINTVNMFATCENITSAYAKNQTVVNKFNTSGGKPSSLNFIVK